MNPQEKENRAENREEKNREEHRKEKTDKPARLGREAKIGATVILLLLATFVAVVVVRMMHSDDKTLASTAEADAGKHRPPAASKDDNPLFRGVNANSFGSHQPTVVPAGAASTKPLGSIDGGLDRWKLPADKTEPKRVESRYGSSSAPPSLPPSFASDPPKPPHANRYDPVASDPLPGLEPEKPSRFDKKSHEEPRFDPPDTKKRAVHADPVGSVTTRRDFERDEPSGYAGAGSPSAYHEKKSRYEDQSAALLPPSRVDETPPYRGETGRSHSAAPASQYDDDFPRESTKPAHDYDRPHRYDAPSYGSLPPRRDDGKYEVQPNDSYWTISEKVYGTGGYFKALAEQNRGKVGNEDRLTPGDLIATPSVAQLEKSYPELCPKASRRETQESRTMNVSTRQSYRGGRTYTVSEGDTLFNIARYELGKASRWAEIYELNRDVLGKDFNYLTPGMKLVLPDGEKADVLTRRSGDLLR